MEKEFYQYLKKINKKQKLKENKEEKEDLNNKNSIKDNKKEGEMARKRCKTGYRRSDKKCIRRTPTKKSVRKAKFKWW